MPLTLSHALIFAVVSILLALTLILEPGVHLMITAFPSSSPGKQLLQGTVSLHPPAAMEEWIPQHFWRLPKEV